MQFTIDDIVHILSDIWTSILGLEVRHIADDTKISSNTRSIIGCIQIAGDWEGAVTLYCPETLARKATSAMFGMPETDIGDEEIQDTMGELTNMLAGNFKTLLPGSCFISLPAVAEGIDYRLTVPGGQVVVQARFESEGEPLLVTVLARER